MSFLTKLGGFFKGAAKVTGAVSPILTEIAPLTGPAAGILAGVGGIGMVVGAIEGVFEKNVPGSQKLALAAPIVEQAILTELSAHGLKMADPDKFKVSVTKLTSDVVDLYNSLEAAPAPTPPATGNPAK